MAEDRNRPFNDDIMTLFMGIEPEEPGQHGRTEVPGPEQDAIGLIVSIRDMCDEWLMQSGKGGNEPVEEQEGVEENGEEEEV